MNGSQMAVNGSAVAATEKWCNVCFEPQEVSAASLWRLLAAAVKDEGWIYCVSIQGLHPLKDLDFESFRETLLTSSAVV